MLKKWELLAVLREKVTFRKGGRKNKGGRDIINTIQVPGLINFDDVGLLNTIDSFNIWIVYNKQKYLLIKILKYQNLKMNLISFFIA